MANSEKEQKLLIAVIDDNELSRRSIVEILESENYVIAGSGSNAQEAMQILLNKKPQIMLIDVVMPDISGIELAQRVTEKQLDTNIIMMSSLNSQNIIIEAICNDYKNMLTTKVNDSW